MMKQEKINYFSSCIYRTMYLSTKFKKMYHSEYLSLHSGLEKNIILQDNPFINMNCYDILESKET